METQAKSYI